MTRLYSTAIEKWGTEAQLWLYIEEQGELAHAMSRYRRDPTDATLEAVAEEIADVTIMLGQLLVLFGIEERSVEILVTKLGALEKLLGIGGDGK